MPVVIPSRKYGRALGYIDMIITASSSYTLDHTL